MTAERTCDDLHLFYDGELPDARRLEFEAHLQACQDCRGALEDLRELEGVLQGDPGIEPSADLPERMAERVLGAPGALEDRLGGAGMIGTARFHLFSPRRIAILLSLAAAAGVALFHFPESLATRLDRLWLDLRRDTKDEVALRASFLRELEGAQEKMALGRQAEARGALEEASRVLEDFQRTSAAFRSVSEEEELFHDDLRPTPTDHGGALSEQLQIAREELARTPDLTTEAALGAVRAELAQGTRNILEEWSYLPPSLGLSHTCNGYTSLRLSEAQVLRNLGRSAEAREQLRQLEQEYLEVAAEFLSERVAGKPGEFSAHTPLWDVCERWALWGDHREALRVAKRDVELILDLIPGLHEAKGYRLLWLNGKLRAWGSADKPEDLELVAWIQRSATRLRADLDQLPIQEEGFLDRPPENSDQRPGSLKRWLDAVLLDLQGFEKARPISGS